MTTRVRVALLLTAVCWATLPVAVGAADAPATGKYSLRYSFRKGDKLRWNVTHDARIRTTINGVTQLAEMHSQSVKVWHVQHVAEKGEVTFVHSVESVLMRQRHSGREELTYDSQRDKEPPLGFQDAARNVGVPLTTITMDAQGQILRRDDHRPQPQQHDNPLTIPLPSQPVAVGESWSFPHEITVQQRDQTVKKVRCRQQFTLESVRDGVATIRMETLILDPVRDPMLEAQLVQRETHGTVELDLDRGLVVRQTIEADKRVVGPFGDASSLHFQMTFREELLTGEARTARRPPEAP
jgi:hypothetical protein